jgi:hypothetical protein
LPDLAFARLVCLAVWSSAVLLPPPRPALIRTRRRSLGFRHAGPVRQGPEGDTAAGRDVARCRGRRRVVHEAQRDRRSHRRVRTQRRAVGLGRRLNRDALPWRSDRPLMFNAPPLPIVAVVRLSATVIANEPPTPTPPGALPPDSACVLSLVAARGAQRHVPAAAQRGIVFDQRRQRPLSTTLMANDAPTPTLPPPEASALASTRLSLVLAAVMRHAPAPAATVEPSRSRLGAVVDTFKANEPATPTSPPLAPEVALAPKRCVASPPTSFIAADRWTPSAVTFAPPATVAWLVMWATLIATATPIAVSIDPSVALPSANAEASMLFDDSNVSGPPAVIVIPLGISATASLRDTLIAKAAATPTEPPLPPSPSVLAV